MVRLVLIDGNAILHRAYHALPQWRNTAGEATSGIYGFFSILLKVRDELAPQYLAVAFDHPSPTFRHAAYVGYQHGRVKDRQLEEDIWAQLEKLRHWLTKTGIAVFQLEGFEADDLLGTLTRQALLSKKPEIDQVVIVTGDRDLLQLVNGKVRILLPLKGLADTVLLDEQGVLDKMGVRPDQIVDYKGLVGDSSDNYPGVPGIGPKTAAALLGHFETIENLYRHLGSPKKEDKEVLTPTVIEKLVEGHAGAEISKQLAEIKTDVPVTLYLEKSSMPSDEALAGLFKEMNYPSLVKRITGESEIVKKVPKKDKAKGQIDLI